MAAGDAAPAAVDAAGTADVGLTVKLQQKLKDEQRNRERLEKRLEELEADKGSKGAEKQTADTIRVSEQSVDIFCTNLRTPQHFLRLQLQELEVENGKIRDDLKKLRDALSDEAGEENAQFKEMIGKRAIERERRAAQIWVRCVSKMHPHNHGLESKFWLPYEAS